MVHRSYTGIGDCYICGSCINVTIVKECNLECWINCTCSKSGSNSSALRTAVKEKERRCTSIPNRFAILAISTSTADPDNTGCFVSTSNLTFASDAI